MDPQPPVEGAHIADDGRVCIVCREAFDGTPWDVMTPDLVNHGPFCSRLCLQDFCSLYDTTHEDVR